VTVTVRGVGATQVLPSWQLSCTGNPPATATVSGDAPCACTMPVPAVNATMAASKDGFPSADVLVRIVFGNRTPGSLHKGLIGCFRRTLEQKIALVPKGYRRPRTPEMKGGRTF
jgi:hypothetical protein